MAEDLKYGPVWITKGAHKGKIMYYDDDMTANRLIVYPCMPLYYNGYYIVNRSSATSVILTERLAERINEIN